VVSSKSILSGGRYTAEVSHKPLLVSVQIHTKDISIMLA